MSTTETTMPLSAGDTGPSPGSGGGGPRRRRALLAAATTLALTGGVAATLSATLGVPATSVTATTTTTATTKTSARRPAGMPLVERIHRTVVGPVRQRLDVGSYLYLELEGADGERTWVVGVKRPIDVGDVVEANAFGARQDFWSARLQRRFPTLWFATLTTAD